ncbi:MAG TPA: enoyl-CoA hydratase-related protein [Saprospiraceae bacterium]|nr:enoyl-CoA hydratase-related protein [Saprospiraceae bacterium]HPI05026.1 enoyl-CoA hydratase-related protein [Saprospiraceae bacterium]
MQYENLQIALEDGIAIVTITREKALNALNRRTMEELEHYFGEAAHEVEGLKGIILTGAGEKAFVAGADITEFQGLSATEGMQLAKRGQDVFFLVEHFPKPVVAAVNGFALGGGCELAMACHLRVAGEKAKFGQPEVNLGLIPGYGGTQRLIQYIGKTKAMELLLTADIIGADDARQLGLVNHVVPSGSEIEKAKELIEKIATKAPFAISKVIECVNAYFEEGVDGFWKEVDAFGECSGTDDFREGAAAFVEKRKATFTGK